MKARVLFFLILVLPILCSGLTTDNNQQIKSRIPQGLFNQHNGNLSQLNQIRIPYQSFIRNRSWRLASITTMADLDDDGDLEAGVIENLYYREVFPGNIDSIVVYFWDDDWQPYNRIEYTYDISGEYILERDTYNYQFIYPQYKTMYYYNTQNRLIEIENWEYDPITYEYNNTAGQFYIYGASSLTESYDYFYPQPGNRHLSRNTYNTDLQGRITSFSSAQSGDSLNWVPTGYTSYIYDSEDTSTGDDYICYLSHEYLSDNVSLDFAFGIVNQVMVSQSWDEDLQMWLTTYRNLYEYNDLYQITTLTVSMLELEWDDMGMYTFSYDANSNMSSYVLQMMPPDSTEWDPPMTMVVYGWEQFTANEDNTMTPVSMSMSAYPNPFNDNLNIRFESKSNVPIKTSIFNIKGQLIKSFDNSSKSITWDGRDKDNKAVSNGIYFIKATQDGVSVNRKVIRIK